MAEEIMKTMTAMSMETGEMTTYRIYDEDAQNRTAGISGLAQEEGDSESLVMSQKAVSEALENQEGQTTPGANGTTFTPSVSADGIISWTNDGGKANPDPVNIKGPQGDPGYTPQKNVDYFDGEDGAPGKDGTSVTHSWNGTTLTITSASGSTSAELKGSPGLAGADGENVVVPDYVQTEARRVAKNVQSRQGANTITFLACSDIHYSTVNNAEQMAESLTHMGQAMKIIRESVAVDFAACLGDSIWDASNESVEDTQEAMRRVNAALFDAFNGIPNFRLVGNHEVHYKGSTKMTNAQIFSNTAAFNAGATFDEANRIGGYCYRDFPDRKLRVVCLNTSEGDDTGGYTTSAAQRTWLANALNVGSGWKSLVLSHIPLDWYGANSAPLTTVKAASGVVCNVHGHIHNYLAGLMAGSTIPRLGIPNGCFYRANEYGENGTTEYNGMEFGEDTTYNKVAGTANDTAFCVVTIDFDNEVIYADRYGAGYDRVMTFDGVVSSPTYSVTYALTNVISKTNVAEVTAGGAYTNDLTAENGYEIASVKVTMGGVDITSSAYDNGLISINIVTGNIVITATATEIPVAPPSVNYTNVVPTAQAMNSTSPYNDSGYKNGYYISSSSPFEGTDSATVLTGYIPYSVPDTNGVPPTIYIKGAEWQSISHCRWFGFDSTKTATKGCQIQGSVSSGNGALTSSFTVTQLGDKYFKLEPIASGSKWKMIDLTASTVDIEFFRMSLVGKGENLIVTLDEPIE